MTEEAQIAQEGGTLLDEATPTLSEGEYFYQMVSRVQVKHPNGTKATSIVLSRNKPERTPS